MKIYESVFTGIGLATDAFAISIMCGICNRSCSYIKQLSPAFVFGIFQAIMLLMGRFLGCRFEGCFLKADGFVSAIILFIIGIKMLLEKQKDEDPTEKNKYGISIKRLMILAFVTSIDSFAAGIAISLKDIAHPPYNDALIVGIITLGLCLCGIYSGIHFGSRFRKHSSFLGGCLLILMGIKTALEALGIDKLIFGR